MKALILDDSKDIRDRVLKLLASNSKLDEIFQAGDIQNAKIIIDREKPELLLLDIQLPDGSAFDLLETIDKKNYKPLIIILTNYNFPEYRAEAKKKGVSFFFNKSTEFVKLKYILQNSNAF